MENVITLPKIKETEPALLFSNKDLAHLFIPLIIEQSLVFMVGLVDSIMVSSLGAAAVSGVSLVGHIMLLFIFIFNALSIGGGVVIGQYLGRKDVTLAREASQQMVNILSLFSIGLMVLLYIGRNYILHLLFGSSSPDVMMNAERYLFVIASSVPFIAVFQSISTVFRISGNTKTPMMVVLAMNILNIIGNAIFIYVLHWNVTGVAVSTCIVRVLSVLILFYKAQDEEFALRLGNSFKAGIQTTLCKKILRIGVPYSVENSLYQVGKLIEMTIIAGLGTTAIATNAVSGAITMFHLLPGLAINVGMTTVIARSLGAGEIEQSKYYTKKIITIILLSSALMSFLVFTFMPAIMKLYGLAPDVLEQAQMITNWHALFAVLVWPLAYSLPVALRSAGDVKYPMRVGIIALVVCRVIGTFVLCNYFHFGLWGAWICLFASWIFRAVFFMYRYASDAYLQHQVI